VPVAGVHDVSEDIRFRVYLLDGAAIVYELSAVLLQCLYVTRPTPTPFHDTHYYHSSIVVDAWRAYSCGKRDRGWTPTYSYSHCLGCSGGDRCASDASCAVFWPVGRATGPCHRREVIYESFLCLVTSSVL